MKPKDIAHTLNELIRVCNDGAEGFKTCVENAKIDSTKLKSLLAGRVRECTSAAEVLREQVRTFGETPATGTTAVGALHRGWINVKAAIAKSNDLAVLEECERGENIALQAYEEALKKDLPLPIRSLLELQHQGVLNNRDLIKKLREEAELAHS